MKVAAACRAALALTQEQTAPSFSRNTNASANWRGSRAAHQCIVCPTASEQATEQKRHGPSLGVSWVHENYLLFGRLRGNAYFELRVYRQGWNEVAHYGPIDRTSSPSATDSRLHLGNEPTQLPESQVCKSKMQVDFYSVYDSKVNATLAWYDAHLPRFKRTHAYAANRSQDTYYKTDGTVLVSVTGSPGKERRKHATHIRCCMLVFSLDYREDDRRPESTKKLFLPVIIIFAPLFRRRKNCVIVSGALADRLEAFRASRQRRFPCRIGHDFKTPPGNIRQLSMGSWVASDRRIWKKVVFTIHFRQKPPSGANSPSEWTCPRR